MRRILAACFILIFVGSPIAQWQCAIACALDDGPVVDVCPHATTAVAELAMQPGHDCDARDSAPVLAARAAHATVIHAPSGMASAHDLLVATAASPAPTPACLGSPPPRFVLPIRV